MNPQVLGYRCKPYLQNSNEPFVVCDTFKDIMEIKNNETLDTR
jgi:hypothetical protein